MNSETMDSLSDKELLTRAVNGDERAFLSLSRRHKNMIYHIAYSYIKDKDETEDVCQEILLKVFQRGHQLSKDNSFQSWLYKIVVNTCLNYIRSRKRFPQINSELPDTDKPADVTPENSLEAQQSAAKIQKCIDMLPEKQRLTLLLKIRDNLKIREISEITHSSLSTIKTNLSIALKKLTQCMEDWHDE